MGLQPRFVGSTRGKTRGVPGASRSEPVVVLVHHPRLTRAGETIPLAHLTEISRLAPSLVAPHGSDPGPPADPVVTRPPVPIPPTPRAVQIAHPHRPPRAL